MEKFRNKNCWRWPKSSECLQLGYRTLELRFGNWTSLASFAVPSMILILDTPIERNPAGKVVKGALRTMATKIWEKRQGKRGKVENLSRL